MKRLAMAALMGLVAVYPAAGFADDAQLNAFPPANLPIFPGTATEVVKERQDYMKQMGKVLKDIKQATSSDDPDRTALRGLTSQLRSLAYGMVNAFPADTAPSRGVDTRTLEKWWTDQELAPDQWSSYYNAADKLDKMVPDAAPDALRDQVKTVAEQCGACHKVLRKPD